MAVVAVAALPPIFKLATGVVEVTTNGAVPVATVEVNWPDTLKLVPVATPNTGVTKVGDVAKTTEPVPVSSVIAPAKLALDGVANHVATPVPKPEISDVLGLAYVNTPDPSFFKKPEPFDKLPMVVRLVYAACLVLNVDQSALAKYPVALAVAVGILVHAGAPLVKLKN